MLFSQWTCTNEKIWVENSVSAIQNIENRKRFTEVPPPPPSDQTNHWSWRGGGVGGGGKRCQNAQKHFTLKTY